MKDIVPYKISDNLFNIRTFGEFEINIRLKVEDYGIDKLNKGYPKFEDGIYYIQYILIQKAETISVITEEV